MYMVGLTQPLDSLGVLLYNERTANYIESFYNDDNSTEGIRGQVLDVSATVDVTGQFGVDGEFTPVFETIPTVRGSRHGHNEYDMANESDEDESYLPEHATANSDNFINARYRFDGINVSSKGGKRQLKGTRMLQIVDSCSGDKIDLVFTVSLSYRLTNSALTQVQIINEPFTTAIRRTIYMEDFLKKPDPGPFVDLTCTGRARFPDGGLPTASPISASIVPTLDVEKPSQQPTIFVTSNDTIVPTLDVEKPSQQPTIFGTSNDTIVPTLDVEKPSQQPTIFGTSNDTIVPTLDVEKPSQQPTTFGTSNDTIVPTLDVEKPSQQPTIFGTSNDTIVPTLDVEKPSQQPTIFGTSNDTTVVTSSSPPSTPGGFFTERRFDVGQDLIGILNLDPISTDVYNTQTAAYISAFYDGDPFLTVFTTSVSVTDESIPIGPIEGNDCSEIDPLTVSFTIEMEYSTINPVSTFEEIIKLPFSTVAFQDRFINDYLKANDVNGGFATLQCVSGLNIPESLVTASPTGAGTGTSAPSITPTEFIDDLLQVRSGLLPERSCLDKVDPKLLDSSEEIEISFLYGVESKTADYFFLDELERLILDFLQVSILMCLEDGEQVSPQVWKIDDRQDTAGVIRVRYPELGEASTMCKFDIQFVSSIARIYVYTIPPANNYLFSPRDHKQTAKCDPTIVDAKGCAIKSTKLLVTSVGVPVNKVHSDVLMLLNDAFKEGAFVEIIPELILTAYVGPDPEEYQLPAQTKASPSSQEGGSNSSRVVALSFSITVVVIAGLVAWFAFPLVRQELIKGAVTCCTRIRQPQGVEENALIVYQGDREETDDDVHGSPQ
jgi:hypothetical protein